MISRRTRERRVNQLVISRDIGSECVISVAETRALAIVRREFQAADDAFVDAMVS